MGIFVSNRWYIYINEKFSGIITDAVTFLGVGSRCFAWFLSHFGVLETVAIGLFALVRVSLFVGKHQLTYPPINVLVYGNRRILTTAPPVSHSYKSVALAKRLSLFKTE